MQINDRFRSRNNGRVERRESKLDPSGESRKIARFSLGWLTVLVFTLMPSTHLFAQNKPQTEAAPSVSSNPIIKHHKMFYSVMKIWLLESAKKMPEENYAFKPTPEVRSYGEILVHVANQHYRFCSIVRGEENPNLKFEKTPVSKFEITAALKEAFSYCDKAYDSMNDKTAFEMVSHSKMDHPKLGLLIANLTHSALHYGNLITYMRMKNIVPPSSQPGLMEPPK